MFAEYLSTSEIVFKHALGCRDLYGKEFHVFNELFFLIKDKAKFTSERIIQEIHANSLVIIPKHQYHQFDHIGPEESYYRFVLQFDVVDGLNEIISEVFDNVKIIQDVGPQMMLLFKRLGSLINEAKSQMDKEILLRAIFTEILMDLKYNYMNKAITEQITDRTVADIISYINHNFLRKNLTIGLMAEHLNFSETYISHKFKDAMHISIYKYILKKRLIHAHQLISEGVSATEAAYLCGFEEYSGFYRIYKKYFGYSPSKTNKSKSLACKPEYS